LPLRSRGGRAPPGGGQGLPPRGGGPRPGKLLGSVLGTVAPGNFRELLGWDRGEDASKGRWEGGAGNYASGTAGFQRRGHPGPWGVRAQQRSVGRAGFGGNRGVSGKKGEVVSLSRAPPGGARAHSRRPGRRRPADGAVHGKPDLGAGPHRAGAWPRKNWPTGAGPVSRVRGNTCYRGPTPGAARCSIPRIGLASGVGNRVRPGSWGCFCNTGPIGGLARVDGPAGDRGTTGPHHRGSGEVVRGRKPPPGRRLFSL